MNSKLIYTATLAVALLGGGAAMASEATQFGIDPSTASRAEVKAELERAQGAGELEQATQAYGGFVTLLGGEPAVPRCATRPVQKRARAARQRNTPDRDHL
ncbi:MAG: DUF4148 domain-containing protein [Rhizobacter sp.]|nr:DUF4148 domain-containing protein [Rhizobacter sp.]